MADYATLLRGRVTLRCRSIDRIFLQGYVPKLQTVGLVCRFLRWQRKFFVPSSAAFGKIGDEYVARVHRFAAEHDIPVAYFDREKKRRKEKIVKEEPARPFLEAAAKEGGGGRVVLLGIAQERASVWRSWKAKGQETARHPHMDVCCYYRSSRIKQHFKLHHALRTETVICDTHDFGIGRRVNQANWRALRAVGEAANQRLCDAQAQDARPAPDVVTFNQVTRPSTTADGLHAPGLPFGDPRAMAVLSAILGFVHCLVGFTNAEVVERVGPLLENLSYSSRQATYDLRRLTRKGVITRIPATQRYQLTPFGRRIATWFSKAHGRVLTPGLAWTDPALASEVASRSPLAVAGEHSTAL